MFLGCKRVSKCLYYMVWGHGEEGYKFMITILSETDMSLIYENSISRGEGELWVLKVRFD